MTPDEAIEAYRQAGLIYVSAIRHFASVGQMFHDAALEEMSALARGELADLTESARTTLLVDEAGKAERAAMQRATEAKIEAIRCILAAKGKA